MSDYGGDDEYEYDFEEDDDALFYTEEPVYEAVGFTSVYPRLLVRQPASVGIGGQRLLLF